MIVTDDPVWDAEKVTSYEQSYIPCDVCGQEIYMPDEVYGGDPYYDVDGEYICEQCFPDYAKKHWYKENYYAES